MPAYENLIQALADLKQRGYTEDFNLSGDCLVCHKRAIGLRPEDFRIDEYYRFEGDSNPDDSSIIFAITSDAGYHGTLVDAYGTYAESVTPEMAEKLRMATGHQMI